MKANSLGLVVCSDLCVSVYVLCAMSVQLFLGEATRCW